MADPQPVSEDADDLWQRWQAGAEQEIWAEWRALLRARRDGRVSEADYRRATGRLRSRLDGLGHGGWGAPKRPPAPAGAPPAGEPPATGAPPASPAPSPPLSTMPPSFTPPPAPGTPPESRPFGAPGSSDGAPLADWVQRYGPMLTFLALVVLLSAAAGYAITRLIGG